MTPLPASVARPFDRSHESDPPVQCDDRKMDWKSEQRDDDGIDRRAFLRYGGGAVGAAGIAGGGWLFYDRVLDRRSPQETVVEFYRALDAGNGERANELVHSRSPDGDVRRVVVTSYEQQDVTVENTELLSQSDTRAEVRVVISGASSETDRQETTARLRTEDGVWKIWND